jgi:hypothetical protein
MIIGPVEPSAREGRIGHGAFVPRGLTLLRDTGWLVRLAYVHVQYAARGLVGRGRCCATGTLRVAG